MTNPENLMKILLCICVLLMNQASNAADVFDGSKPMPFMVGDRLANGLTIGGYPIWKGEGKWRIFDLSTANAGGGAMPVPLGTLSVFQTEEKKFVALMRVTANLAQASASDWTDSPCKRDDMLFKASIGGPFNNVNCITINHITGYPGNPGGRNAELYALLKEQAVEIPPTVIQIVFTRYTNNLRRLVVVLYVNPELAGFPRDNETQWGRNSWHKSQATNDPGKTRFIEALSKWSVQFGKQMNIAFDKKAEAFTAVESWRTVYSEQPMPISVKPKIILD
jgi:hypothetical protein